MKKKLVSLLIAGSVVASMAAIASVSTSALVDADGRYTPAPGLETNRYYFALPKTWESDAQNAHEAGAYWWSGSESCGAVDGSGGTTVWPGYKAQKDGFASDNYKVFYVDCPTDVAQIVWNNYVDGGEDPTAPIYSVAKQTNNCPTEFYSDGDSDLYDSEFFELLEASYEGDKALLGDFADNFFVDEDFGLGFSFNFDNMIFIAPAEPNGVNDYNQKPTYTGEWYFYYGDGEYGSYPTKEMALEKGEYGTLNDAPKPVTPPATNDEPTKPQPSTDPTSSVKPGDNENGAVQTGESSYAAILFVLLAAVSGAVVLARKKFD